MWMTFHIFFISKECLFLFCEDCVSVGTTSVGPTQLLVSSEFPTLLKAGSHFLFIVQKYALLRVSIMIGAASLGM